MLILKLIGWSALLAFTGSLTACRTGGTTASRDETEPTEPTMNINQNLKISAPDESGELVRVGTLKFDEAHRAKLVTEGTGPAVKELKDAWAEISKLKELTWKQSRPEVMDGRKVTRIVAVPVRPGTPNYIYAVMSTLERKYGLTVDLETE